MRVRPKPLCQLFDAFIGSILNYGIETWGFGRCEGIERVHLKHVLKVRNSTSSVGVYGEIGRYPSYITVR